MEELLIGTPTGTPRSGRCSGGEHIFGRGAIPLIVFSSFLDTRPLQMAISVLQTRRELAHCSHSLGSGITDAGFPDALPYEMMRAIMSACDFQALIAFASLGSTYHTEAKRLMKSRAVTALQDFLPEGLLRDFFKELANSEGYIFGDVPLKIVMRKDWDLRFLHIAVPRGSDGPLVYWLAFHAGYNRSSLSPARKHCIRSTTLFNKVVGVV